MMNLWLKVAQLNFFHVYFFLRLLLLAYSPEMIMIIIMHDESMDKGCSVNIFPCRPWHIL